MSQVRADSQQSFIRGIAVRHEITIPVNIQTPNDIWHVAPPCLRVPFNVAVLLYQSCPGDAGSQRIRLDRNDDGGMIHGL